MSDIDVAVFLVGGYCCSCCDNSVIEEEGRWFSEKNVIIQVWQQLHPAFIGQKIPSAVSSDCPRYFLHLPAAQG